LKHTHRITNQSERQEQRDRVAGSIEHAMENARQSSGFKRRRQVVDLTNEDEFEPRRGQ
jgi:hypothetical protein